MPGFVDLMEGRYEAAATAYEDMYRMDPGSPFSAITLGWVLTSAGRTGEALDVLDRAAADHPGTPFGTFATSLGHGLRGEPARALQDLGPLEEAARENEMFARLLTHCLAQAGARDAALESLERTVRLGLLNEPFLARHDRLLDGLRDDPRFARLMARARERLEALGPVARPR